MKGSKALLITLVMTAGLTALAIVLRGPYARLAAEHWRVELANAPDDRARGLLDELVELGEPGVPVLVEAVGAERPYVARTANQMLIEQLGRWQNVGGRDSARKQAVLAAALADRARRFGPAARLDAAHLATQILLWLPEEKTIDRSQVIAACEKVLQASAGARYWAIPSERSDRVGAGMTSSPTAGGHPADELPLGPHDATLGGISSVEESARIPGGGLPIDSLPGNTLRRGESSNPRTADAPARPPQSFGDPQAARPLKPGEDPRGPRLDPHEPAPVTVTENVPAARQTADQAAAAGIDESPEQAAFEDLAKTDTVALMRRLHSPAKSTIATAQAELVRRGFSEVQLDLARRLFDADPGVRKELAQLLPDLHSVDAVPWLLWLARDKDAEVRLLAFTMLATTSNPAMLEELQQMAQADTDPRIQHCADRLSQQRSGKRR